MATNQVVWPSASYNADQPAKLITVTEKYEAAHVVVDITAGAPNLTVTLGGYDAFSKKTYSILTSVLNSGTTVLRIDPALTAGANIAKDRVPYQLSVAVTQSGGVAATYSVAAYLL